MICLSREESFGFLITRASANPKHQILNNMSSQEQSSCEDEDFGA